MKRFAMMAGVLALGLCIGSAGAATVYSNDFETNAAGFSRTNTAPFYNVATRATQSRFLGGFGPESVTLSLSGLTPGREHSLAFDLYIGGPWAGNSPSGVDRWRLTVGGVMLIDTTFSNTKQNDFTNLINPRTQNYSDATPNGPVAQPAFTGADVVFDVGTNGVGDFAIYYFGHGVGNPMLKFTPLQASIDITFSGVGPLNPSSDLWALDNVRVETEDVPVEAVPTPGAAAAGLGLLAMVGWRRRKP